MVAPSGLLAGNGSPEGSVVGNPGQRYRDLDNDNLYIKITGTSTAGWLLNGKFGDGGTTSSSSSGGGVVTYAADPTGLLSHTGVGLCIGTGAVNGGVWYKTTTGTSADDWVQLIAPI